MKKQKRNPTRKEWRRMIKRFGVSLSFSCNMKYVYVWWKGPEKDWFCDTDKKGKHLHLASGAVKDRKVLGWLVQRPVCSLSHLPCAKTAPACRLDLSLRLLFDTPCIKQIWIGSFGGISGQSRLFGWIQMIQVLFQAILPLTAQFHPSCVPLYRSGQAWQRPYYWTDAR